MWYWSHYKILRSSCLYSQLLWHWGRRIAVSSDSAWATQLSFRPIWVTEWDPLSKPKCNKQTKYWRSVVRVQYLLCLVPAEPSFPWKHSKMLEKFPRKRLNNSADFKELFKMFRWVTCEWTCRLNFHLSPHVLRALTGKCSATQAGFCWTQSSLRSSTSPNVAGSSIPALAIQIQSTVKN